MNDLKIAEELKELLYNMSEICEEIGKEKHAITKQVTRMELLLNELTTRVVELEKIGKETKRETVVAIEKAGDKLSKQTGDAATIAVKQELLQPIERFEKTVILNRNVITSWKEIAWMSYLAGCLIALLVCFLASVLTVKAMLPNPTAPFTDEQFKTYSNGKFMEKIMEKLSPEERARMEAIGRGENVEKLSMPVIEKGAAKQKSHAKHKHQRSEFDAQVTEETTDLRGYSY